MRSIIKKKLRNLDLVLGSWITLAHPSIAEIMSRSGFDWIAIDLEHSAITIREAEELIRVIDLCGVSPLVRLTSNNSDLIKRVMDSGAHGVIVPMVNSREDAEKAVSSVYYPNKGTRGVGLARAQGYGTSFKTYRDSLQESAVVIVMIEHKDAVENLEAILTTEGIDGYFLGPYDLSASMGKPGNLKDPEVEAAIQKVCTIAKKLGIPGGIHVVEPNSDDLQTRVDEGFTFLAYSLDTRMLDTTCRSAVNKIRK